MKYVLEGYIKQDSECQWVGEGKREGKEVRREKKREVGKWDKRDKIKAIVNCVLLAA